MKRDLAFVDYELSISNREINQDIKIPVLFGHSYA